MIKRRDFLKRAGAGIALAAVGAACGGDDDPAAPAADLTSEDSVAHLLPTVSSDRILIKASFLDPQEEAPDLWVDGAPIAGRATDSDGTFWVFDAAGLEAGRRYTLEIRRGRRRLIEPWELATFPAPSARPDRFRLLAYTCPGGNDIFRLYVPVEVRRRLLRRALDFAPDAAVVNGDHVYWDLRAGPNALLTGKSRVAEREAGVFERDAAVLGHANEGVLKRAVGPQIIDLYGTMFRSLPVFFLRDDHDYFEDDQVTAELTTFPPDDFMRRLARATQWLYYPEFLPDPHRPATLPGAAAADRPAGVGEAFGTLRYGGLFEALLYDCKGYMQIAGADGGLVPADVEAWLLARTADASVDHVVHVPSNPPGWTAGKYAEWYPDVLSDGMLTTAIPKPGWQEGWLAQHDRLLAAASAERAVPLFVSGDIHSIAEGRIVRSGTHDFAANPIVSVLTGSPGTRLGWPSAARGTIAMPPIDLALESVVPVEETNGFQLIDVEPDRIVIRHFRWNSRVDPPELIDGLMPFHVSEYAV